MGCSWLCRALLSGARAGSQAADWRAPATVPRAVAAPPAAARGALPRLSALGAPDACCPGPETKIPPGCRPLSDEELDAMLPGASEGYKILSEPPG